MCKAFPPSKVAETLSANHGTVEKYLQDLRKKYNAGNRHELLYMLYEGGYLLQKILLATPKELEVLSQLVLGKDYVGIGSALGINASTVDQHIKNLVRKNDCHTSEELVVLYANWEKQNAENSTF